MERQDAGFKSFRIGYIQPAVNFPPMTAKYLYERFTEHIKDQERIVIYDPSSGWGGRILGAMGVRDDRRIHYVGTDPNPDNFLLDGDGSKYEKRLANTQISNSIEEARTSFLLHHLTSTERHIRRTRTNLTRSMGRRMNHGVTGSSDRH